MLAQISLGLGRIAAIWPWFNRIYVRFFNVIPYTLPFHLKHPMIDFLFSLSKNYDNYFTKTTAFSSLSLEDQEWLARITPQNYTGIVCELACKIRSHLDYTYWKQGGIINEAELTFRLPRFSRNALRIAARSGSSQKPICHALQYLQDIEGQIGFSLVTNSDYERQSALVHVIKETDIKRRATPGIVED